MWFNSQTKSIVLQANLAKWEPCHGRFRFFHPWKQYLKIGNLARECAYRIEALNNILQSEIQVQYLSHLLQMRRSPHFSSKELNM